MIPACIVRQADDSLRLIIDPILDSGGNGKGKEDIAARVQQMTSWLEKTVRAYPDQWNWMNIRSWENDDIQRSAGHDRTSEIEDRSS